MSIHLVSSILPGSVGRRIFAEQKLHQLELCIRVPRSRSPSLCCLWGWRACSQRWWQTTGQCLAHKSRRSIKPARRPTLACGGSARSSSTSARRTSWQGTAADPSVCQEVRRTHNRSVSKMWCLDLLSLQPAPPVRILRPEEDLQPCHFFNPFVQNVRVYKNISAKIFSLKKHPERHSDLLYSRKCCTFSNGTNLTLEYYLWVTFTPASVFTWFSICCIQGWSWAAWLLGDHHHTYAKTLKLPGIC